MKPEMELSDDADRTEDGDDDDDDDDADGDADGDGDGDDEEEEKGGGEEEGDWEGGEEEQRAKGLALLCPPALCLPFCISCISSLSRLFSRSRADIRLVVSLIVVASDYVSCN